MDAGGESHLIQRFTDPQGRWIELDEFGAESPTAYLRDLNAGVPTEDVTYPYCVDLTTGPEAIESTLIVAHHPDRTILGTQEWEYGGFTISGGPDVTLDDLLAVASGLRTP